MFPFACGNTKHKFFREPLCITFYGLIHGTRRNLIQCHQVEVEHHALAADFVDFILDKGYIIHKFGLCEVGVSGLSGFLPGVVVDLRRETLFHGIAILSMLVFQRLCNHFIKIRHKMLVLYRAEFFVFGLCVGLCVGTRTCPFARQKRIAM